MIPSQYRMAISITLTDENDPEFPVGTKWFDASQWLKQPQYIKASDYYLINASFVPVKEPIGFEIIIPLLYRIQKNQYAYPELDELVKMDNQQLDRRLEGKITWEYTYSGFNSETLQPEEDYFLIQFPYHEQWYEVEMMRTPYKDGYHYMAFFTLYKAGGWYKQNDILTYKLYLSEK